MSRQLAGRRSEGSVIPTTSWNYFPSTRQIFVSFRLQVWARDYGTRRADNRWNRQDLEKAKRQSEAEAQKQKAEAEAQKQKGAG